MDNQLRVLGSAIQVVVNMLGRDNTPVREEAAATLLAAFTDLRDTLEAQTDPMLELGEAIAKASGNITENKRLVLTAEVMRVGDTMVVDRVEIKATPVDDEPVTTALVEAFIAQQEGK